MGERITFIVPVQPRPKKGGKGKGEFFKKGKDGKSYWDHLQEARKHCKAMLQGAWEPVPHGQLVLVSQAMVFPRYARKPNWVPLAWWKSGKRFPRLVRPDAENCGGFILDALQARKGHIPFAYHDDAQVEIGTWRRWVAAVGEPAHIVVTLERVPWVLPSSVG